MWLNESSEEALSEIAHIVDSLGDGDHEFVSINRVPPETEYDEFPYMDQWMQAAGEKQQLVVEVKRLEADGIHRLYVVGRAATVAESKQIGIGTRQILAYPEEIMGFDQAMDLFTHYYKYDTIPDGWFLRLRDEYSHEL